MIAVALYYSAVALPVKTVFKKIYLDKRANYYEAFFYQSLVFWRKSYHWKLRLLCWTAYAGELQADPYLVGML